MSTASRKKKVLTKRDLYLREEYQKFRAEQQAAWIARYEANLGNEFGYLPFKIPDSVVQVRDTDRAKKQEQEQDQEQQQKQDKTQEEEQEQEEGNGEIRIIG